MKRGTLAVLAVLFWVSGSGAQDTRSAADAPASKEDIQRYLEVTHSREMMKNIMDVMSKSVRQLAHDEYAKNRQSMPADAEERLNRRTDELLKSFPFDEMVEVTVGVYQKHWTKTDVDNMIAFYSTPTGQKLIREMPQTMAEAMDAMRPVMLKHLETMRKQMGQEVAELKKEHEKTGSPQKQEPVSN